MLVTNRTSKIYSVNHSDSSLRVKKSFYLNNLPVDTVNFTGKRKFEVELDEEMRAKVADGVKSGTSGYRATLEKTNKEGKIFNKPVVQTITQAFCIYNAEKAENDPSHKTILVGGDTRVATKKYAPLIRKQLLDNGFDVLYAKTGFKNAVKNFLQTGNLKCLYKPMGEIPTPVLALSTREKNAGMAILLTASHNPWDDAGYNFVTKEATIAPSNVTKAFHDNILKLGECSNIKANVKEGKGKMISFDPYKIYSEHLDKVLKIKWNKIKAANIYIGYDGLQGTGSSYFPRLLKEHGIKINALLNSKKEGPNPVSDNLGELTEKIQNADSKLKIGLANDGDSDRFGIVDENGTVIDPNDVLLLTLYHLMENGRVEKGKGTVVRSTATTTQLDVLAEANDLDLLQTPVGFKFIGEEMLNPRDKNKPVILGGEESGGLTIKDNIPEKDGFAALLMMLELMAEKKKNIGEIIKDIKAEIKEKSGYNFKIERQVLSFDEEEQKNGFLKIFEDIINDKKDQLGEFDIDVEKTQDVHKEMRSFPGKEKSGDGAKIYIKDRKLPDGTYTYGSTLLIRKSGTEPVARVYIEAIGENEKEVTEKADKLLEIATKASKQFGGKLKSH